MTEPATRVRAAQGLPAAQRGTLDIADRVLTKIAARAAGEVDGVGVRSRGGVGHLLDSSGAHLDAQHTTVSVTIAVHYPLPVFDTAERVRHRVAARLAELAGLAPVEVRVEITELCQPRGPVRSRVE